MMIRSILMYLIEFQDFQMFGFKKVPFLVGLIYQSFILPLAGFVCSGVRLIDEVYLGTFIKL